MAQINIISLRTILLLLFVTGIVACKNDKKQAESSQAVEVSPDKDTVEVDLNASDEMQYDKNKITVYDGQVVMLTLTHTGSSPKTTMGHDFILLKDGVSAPKFARKANKSEDNDYIPKDKVDDIIAHTKLLGGGESDTITFDAPDPGKYDYLCSFPGHYDSMQGKFIVK